MDRRTQGSNGGPPGPVVLKTALTERLGLTTPIVQGPMGAVSLPELSAAVSNAGGLGIIGLSWASPDEISALIEKTRSLTPRPFGINLVLEWDQRERLARALAAGVRVVSLSWGDPGPYLAMIREAGACAILTVGSAQEARAAVEAGIDVILAQGVEAGGHVVGQVGTMVLVPAVVDAVALALEGTVAGAARATPVIAAGGIADGRGLAAALMLGAAGVCCGTRFLASEEAYAHADYKRRILEARETDTCYSLLFDGGWPDAPHRTLINRVVAEWMAAGRPVAGARPGEGASIGRTGDGSPMMLYDDVSVTPDIDGDLEKLPLYAGQGAGLVSSIKPAGEIVAEMTAEAVAALGVVGRRPPPAGS
jgi:nitronate monooxygenase